MIRLATRRPIFLSILCLLSCAINPSKHYDQHAEAFGLTRKDINTGVFDLAVYVNAEPPGEYFHVYLEGDGTPFLHRTHINSNPTSRSATALRLMARDPHQAVLIGRPCYHQTQKQNSPCNNHQWWTSHRYSSEVVEALRNAINQLVPTDKKIRLIGFSGGGSLAMLVAGAQPNQIKEIITISANLDTEAWTRHNGYTPLYGSLNPMHYLSSLEGIESTHFVGTKDTPLGYKRWQGKIESQTNASMHEHVGFDHNCCWPDIWTTLLQNLDR